MTEITQADRDAAGEVIEALLVATETILMTSEECEKIILQAFARHRMEERAAIVAWFRKTAEAIRKDADDGLWDEFTESEVQEAIEDEVTNANMIEAGEHLK